MALTLDTLPDDVVFEICDYIDNSALTKLGQSCAGLYYKTKTYAIGKDLFFRFR